MDTHSISISRCSSGRPAIFRKMIIGSCWANWVMNSHSPAAWKPSISEIARARASSVQAAMAGGVKAGMTSLRYFSWSGGSISRGMAGGRSLAAGTKT